MGKIAYNVSPWDLGELRSLMPCCCNQDPYAACTFYVKTSSSKMHMIGKGPRIANVIITCNNCGQTTRANIEDMEIYESDLNF